MCYVYILKCAGGSFYTGYTPDLCRRMRAHVAGRGGSYTHAHLPRELAGLWECSSATAARRLEYAIKHRLSHREKEELLDHPETAAELFPQLGEYEYRPRQGITLQDCTEGRFDG